MPPPPKGQKGGAKVSYGPPQNQPNIGLKCVKYIYNLALMHRGSGLKWPWDDYPEKENALRRTMLISREICICGKNAIDEKVLKIVEIGYLKWKKFKNWCIWWKKVYSFKRWKNPILYQLFIRFLFQKWIQRPQKHMFWYQKHIFWKKNSFTKNCLVAKKRHFLNF